YGVLAAFTGAFFGIYNGKLIIKHNSSHITIIEFIGALVAVVFAKYFLSNNLLSSVCVVVEIMFIKKNQIYNVLLFGLATNRSILGIVNNLLSACPLSPELVEGYL
ncbi:MAG: hypothetical protein ACEQSC_02460, partial [Candidatus Nanopelagicaceae bacterium]